MVYRIADLYVKMNPQYNPLKTQIIPYLATSSSSIDCTIPQGEDAIYRYHQKHPELTMGEAEYLLYGAYFYDALLDHQGIFLHASCIVHKGYAYLFSAPSGTGKSTHTQLWRKAFPESFILNDDKPAIRIKNNQLEAYGTPFSGKTNQNINEHYPLAGIAFLKRSKVNEIHRITSKEAIPLILSQTMPPYHEGRLDQMMAIINLILERIPIYELNANMDEDAALVSYQGMRKDSTNET